MNLSTENTPQQKLSKFSVDNVSAINITHLLVNDLKEVAKASDQLNQQAGWNKAIHLVVARNISNEYEIEDFVKFCITKKINNSNI